MGSSKTAQALMCKFNYEQQDFKVLLIKPALDTRDITPEGKVVTRSRIGLESECYTIDKDENLYKFVFNKNQFKDNSVVIVDECQFATKKQIEDLRDIATYVPVICYGLKTNFKTELFEGSKRLIELADSITELKSICKCGHKSIINARMVDGKPVTDGEEVVIGGDETYEAMCYDCFKKLKGE
jgi:thymidine kinase